MIDAQQSTQPSRRTLFAVLAVLLAGGAALAPARAQMGGNPLVGVWSTTTYLSDGSPYLSFFVSYGPDGSVQQRTIGPAGQNDVFGRYQLSADGQYLQTVFLDYEPKQLCSSGFCNPLPPPGYLNQTLTTPIQFQGPNRMQTQDASGPMLWVRQQ
ncbi:hypothetical protein [Zavarzinia sp. CC-PAN008]|uniref:hypothetical protein n=1 Tax=Zavarzinia sp. CC-PAN008 TaxID=3243332 RepID=UPI003F747955